MRSLVNQRPTYLHIESHSTANGRINWCINMQTTGSLIHPCATLFMNTADQWAMHGFVAMGGSMRGSWQHDYPPESPSTSNGLINGRINEQHNGKWATCRITLCLDRVIHCVIHVAMHCSLLCLWENKAIHKLPESPMCLHRGLHGLIQLVGESPCSSTWQIKEEYTPTWITHWINTVNQWGVHALS